MKKKICILLLVIILLAILIFVYKNVKLQKQTNVNNVPVNEKYEQIFNSFTNTIMLMDKHDKGSTITKSDLSNNEKLEIIKSLINKEDFTDSKEKAEFNESLAKTRVIKKAVLSQKYKDYFNEDAILPDELFIFPYLYKIKGDEYVGEAVITGMESGPGWDYKAATYSINDDELTLKGVAFFYDFDKYCSDEECKNVVEVSSYDSLLEEKDSFIAITISFTKNKNGSYLFKSIKIDE